MNLSNNRFAQMADQVRAGHAHVLAQFHREMEPCMLRAVNICLTHGAPASPLHRRVATLIRQWHVSPTAGPDERLRVARALCQRMVNRIAPRDTEAHDMPQTLVA